MKLEILESIIRDATEAALEGELLDDTRLQLYRLALTLAADEFHAIETETPGSVDPAKLIAIQQLTLICEPDIDTDKLMDAMSTVAEKINVH